MNRLNRDSIGLKRSQQVLKRNHFRLYAEMLRGVLEDYPGNTGCRSLLDCLNRGDYDTLLAQADLLSKLKYLDATSHYVANQLSLLIRKFPWPTGTISADPGAKARASFAASELRCKRVNLKHRLLSWDRSRDRFSKEVGACRSWIRSVIGSRPNYASIADKCDFGPGASVGIHGNATSYAAKLAATKWTVTPGALHHGYLALKHNFHAWEGLLPRNENGFVCYDEQAAFAAYLSRIHVVANNKICFVPKTAMTDRTIAVEPLMNGLFQKGIDEELRKKLLKVGIDLRDQGRNQELARLGSLDDSDDGFVTVDLKSASDSISTEVVRRLIPDDWFRLLDRTRSHAYELDGTVKVFEKFCSMGNGFCFPLETLIFASVCVASGCGRPFHDFIVYGDDLIFRKRHAARVLQLLGHLGFKINTDKTFLEGPFRESCGTDWFGGEDVRPFTLDYRLDSLQNVFKFLNLSRRNERSINFFRDVRSCVVKALPVDFRFFRPFTGNEDTGIDSTGDEHLYCKSVRVSRHGRFLWKELAFLPKDDRATVEKLRDQPWLISVALRGGHSIRNGRYKFLPEVTLRRQVETKVVRKGYVSTSNWLPPPHGSVMTPAVLKSLLTLTGR